MVIDIEGLHPIENKVKMDIGELKDLFGDKMVIANTISFKIPIAPS